MGDKTASVPKGKIISAVASDMIWKDFVRKDRMTQIQVWPSRWNWIIEENEKMYDAMAGKRPLSPYDWDRWDHPEKLLKEEKLKGKKEKVVAMFPPIPAQPSQPSIPTTTNAWYGFLPKINGRSIVTDRQKWCKVTVGQHNLPRVFGWPDMFD